MVALIVLYLGVKFLFAVCTLSTCMFSYFSEVLVTEWPLLLFAPYVHVCFHILVKFR